MVDWIRNTLDAAGKQLRAITLSRLPIINATELTKSSWAKPIKSYDLVPDIYKNFFKSLLFDGKNFPYTVLAPSYERFIHKTTEKLICDNGDEIWILERAGNAYEALCYPLAYIRYVEYRTMLLDSSIKISGVTRQGVTTPTTIKFNTITDYLIKPILDKIRLAASEPQDVDQSGIIQSPELENFDYLVRLNFKFMNYAKNSLIRGEKVLHAIYQPEIRESVWTVLGRTYYRTIFPTHMSILTDRELIMIRENEARSGKDKYGGTWIYIPLNQIERISLSEKNGHLLVLSIHLPGDEQLKFLFRDSLRPEIDQLRDRFRE